MSQPLVVLTRRIPPAGLHLLQRAAVRTTIIEADSERLVQPDRLREQAAIADVLLTLLTERISRDILEACPRLRGIANMAVGFNNIDIPAATAMGIPVTNTPGVLTDTTADLTWALLLGIARRIVEADDYMRAGRYTTWGPELLLGSDVSPGGSGERKSLGIIGYGRIGRAVARRAVGFDMDVVAYSPGRTGVEIDGTRFVALDELLRSADYVTIHAPGNSATRHMIGRRELAMMKPTSYIVNVARGDIIDEAALVEALQSGRIAGAALDVFENEPGMAPGLAACRNALIVPHIGSASIDTRNRMASLAARNAIAHARAERAPDVVNPDVYDTPEYRDRIAHVTDD